MATFLDTLGLRRLERKLGFRRRQVETSHGTATALVGQGDGDGPPLVLLHGVGSRGTHYARLVERMLPRLGQVVLPDFLGHGLSGPPSAKNVGVLVDGMTETLDQVMDEPFLMFGNSMGGYGALKVAARRPDRVRGVIVNSPAGGKLDDDTRAQVIAKLRLDSHKDALHLVEISFARPPARHVVAWAVRKQLTVPDVRTIIESVGAQDDLDPDELARLSMPVKVLWGDAEGLLRPEQLAWLRQAMPAHAAFEEPAGFGHSPYVDRPVELAERILAFFDDHGRSKNA